MSDLPGVHPSAAQGFDKAPDVYEKARPDFPEEAIRFLAQTLSIGPGTRVLDLAAGTGKLTRRLLPLGASVTAVEPVEGMRQKFSAILPKIPIIAGTAEAIPLPDQSLDVVTVAVAFHWFDGDKALAEIHRVLKPGGRLGLLWNVRDESDGWMRRLMEKVEAYENNTPRYKSFEWKKAFDRTTLLSLLEKKEFPFFQEGGAEAMLNRIRSISFVAALPPQEQERLLAEARELMEKEPELKANPNFRISQHTAFYWCFKR